jgi:hypothetical protein
MHVTILEEEHVDAVTFAAVSRRVSLLTLSAAGLAVANPSVTDAKKKGKKKKGDVNKRCKAQAEGWITLIEIECGPDTDPECQPFIACGEPLRTCNFTAFFDCYLAAIAP